MSSDELHLTTPPTVTATMGIRAPADEVFDAFVDPAQTKRFWIAESTGPLSLDAAVTWDMNGEGACATVNVTRFEPACRLTFQWGDDDEGYATVDFSFDPWHDDDTFVTVTESGFDGTGDDVAARAADSTGGFTMVLCSLKALVEHGIELQAVTDRTR